MKIYVTTEIGDVSTLLVEHRQELAEVFLSYLNNTPELRSHIDTLLEAQKKYVAANSNGLEGLKRFIGRLKNESTENKIADFKKNIAALKSKEFVRVMDSNPDKFVDHAYPLFLYLLSRISFTISLLKDDPLAQAILVTPLEYGELFNCLECITRVASNLKSCNVRYKSHADTLY
ncbi:MAG: hypothetical protein M3R00_08065, partial [Pseudomonadota bacterium]|nr:hypothetical protein [Pseudomonadota bacterium]